MKARHAAVVAGLALGLMSGTARAAFVDTFTQVGNNVVVQGVGSLDTSDLQLNRTQGIQDSVDPGASTLVVGGSSIFNSDTLYLLPDSTFTSFGQSISSTPDLVSGDVVGFQSDDLFVPSGYTSGSNLSSYAEFQAQTLRSLGLVSGTYAYTFGSGTDIDTFTVIVLGSVSAVPLPASAPMFGAALMALGAVGYRVKRKGKAAAAA